MQAKTLLGLVVRSASRPGSAYHVRRPCLTTTTSLLSVIMAAFTPCRCSSSSTFSFSSSTPEQTDEPRQRQNEAKNENPDDSLAYEFDPLASLQHDVAVETARKSWDVVLQSLLPPTPPDAISPETITRIRTYLAQHPVDALITAPWVQVTHVEEPTQGETKVSRPPVPLCDALAEAAAASMNLTQMSTRDDVAFCRIRREIHWIARRVAPELQVFLDAAAVAAEQGDENKALKSTPSAAPHKPRRPKPLLEHVFRDTVDAHFIGWKSRKIADELRKGHPVRLSIKEFQDVGSAVGKLREICEAIHDAGPAHRVTNLTANERGASASLSPLPPSGSSATAPRTTAQEWAQLERRMTEACNRAGLAGTYVKNPRLKPRNVGATFYRVDKYGRRVE